MAAIQSVDGLLDTFAASEDDEKESKTYGDIETNLVYAKDEGIRFSYDFDKKKNIMSLKPIKHKVLNGRNAGCMFGSHGFQLLNQKTSLSTKDFYTNPDKIIENKYYKEIEETVKALTGAQFVTTMHHQVRAAGTKPQDAHATVNVAAPVHAIHCDYTPYHANKSLQSAIPKLPKDDGIDYTKGRFAVINVWRNISDTNTIQNDHLAVMDGRSAVAPDDFLKYDYIGSGHKNESYHLNADHQQFHKWYYFPGMKKNELLVFMQYDSDFQAASRFGFHTAIQDPTADPVNGPKRESIDARIIAFFPKHTPNTIPIRIKESPIETAVKGISAGIKMPDLWPDDAKRMLTEKLRDCDIREVIEWLVERSKDGGDHGLSEASDEECKNVVDEIMKNKDEFKEIALKHFPSK